MLTTPDTTAYLALGLTVALGSLGLYVGSLVLRARNLAKQRETLLQLEQD